MDKTQNKIEYLYNTAGGDNDFNVPPSFLLGRLSLGVRKITGKFNFY